MQRRTALFSAANSGPHAASNNDGTHPVKAVPLITFQLPTSAEQAPELYSAAEGSPKEPKISQAGYDVTPLTLAERKEIAKELTPRQRAITLEAGTEGPFSGKTVNGYVVPSVTMYVMPSLTSCFM